VSDLSKYTLPQGIVGLTGPVARPAPGTLPLRGDLAHVALAGTHLAAHYIIPMPRSVGDAPSALRLNPEAEADAITMLEARSPVEALDFAGEWAWVCKGPKGPSGYILITELAE
jgi:hypothetical protein